MPRIRALLICILAGLLLASCNPAENESQSNISQETSPHDGHDAKEHNQSNSQSSPAAQAFFIAPQPGQSVSSPVRVQMGIKGLKIESAGQVKPNSGHYHLIINAGPVPPGQPVPNDQNHLHFADGQTETQLTLKPGTYKLTLQVADGTHRSLGEAMSETISIQVK